MSLLLMGAGKARDAPAPSATLTDTFTDTNGVLLTAHTSDSGHTWAKTFNFPDDLTINTNRIFGTGASNFARHAASWTPASADYTATITVDLLTLLAGSFVEVSARQATGVDTGYRVFLGADNTLQLVKYVAGAATHLTGSPLTLTAGDVVVAATTRTVGVQVAGTTVSALLDGVTKLTATDSAIAAAGKATVRCRNSTATTGLLITSITAS